MRGVGQVQGDNRVRYADVRVRVNDQDSSMKDKANNAAVL